MQLIAADIGNSSTKIAVDHTEHDDRWSMETVIRGNEVADLDVENLDIDGEAAFWSVSSVNQKRADGLAAWVSKKRPRDKFHLIGADEVDLETDVESREQLGRDRLIAAWQAVQLNDGGPLIVIDAGTAVTIDLVTAENMHLGGVILPGAQSNFKTLAAQTDSLPDFTPQWDAIRNSSGKDLKQIGKSTDEAIFFGVINSQIATMRVAVHELMQQYGTMDVYLTGGGSQDLLDWLPQQWQHVPDLVLQGAKSIGRNLMAVS